MEESKTLAAKNGIVFKEKMMRGDIGYNIVKLAQGKEKFDMIIIGARRSEEHTSELRHITISYAVFCLKKKKKKITNKKTKKKNKKK